MKKLLTYVCIIASLLLSVGDSVPATAQDSGNDNDPIVIDMENNEGSFSIQQEVETKATVELVIGGQMYQLTVPVTLQIDTTKPLTDAQISAPASQQIGSFLFEPIAMKVLEGDYEQSYRTVEPSSEENVLVLYEANVTNLGKETVNAAFTAELETVAIDDAGNRYEEETRFCDEVGPGEKVPCLFIFDVPSTTNLVDLDVSAKSYRLFNFSALEQVE